MGGEKTIGEVLVMMRGRSDLMVVLVAVEENNRLDSGDDGDDDSNGDEEKIKEESRGRQSEEKMPTPEGI